MLNELCKERIKGENRPSYRKLRAEDQPEPVPGEDEKLDPQDDLVPF